MKIGDVRIMFNVYIQKCQLLQTRKHPMNFPSFYLSVSHSSKPILPVISLSKSAKTTKHSVPLKQSLSIPVGNSNRNLSSCGNSPEIWRMCEWLLAGFERVW